MRAVRDHLADALSTLPGLLDEMEPASLHFYFANLTSLRRLLSPSLVAAYEQWTRTGELEPLKELTEAGRNHWSTLAGEILALHEYGANNLAQEITELVENRAF